MHSHRSHISSLPCLCPPLLRHAISLPAHHRDIHLSTAPQQESYPDDSARHVSAPVPDRRLSVSNKCHVGRTWSCCRLGSARFIDWSSLQAPECAAFDLASLFAHHHCDTNYITQSLYYTGVLRTSKKNLSPGTCSSSEVPQ